MSSQSLLISGRTPLTWCKECRRWFTATTGTLLERTKVPISTWLVVAWHLVQTKIGVSALSVQRITGVNYATAWLLLQKMRAAVDQGDREKLSGDIEFTGTEHAALLASSGPARHPRIYQGSRLTLCEPRE